MTHHTPLLPLLAAICLTGCTVGPDFRSPDSRTPAAWRDASANATPDGPITTLADPRPDWWNGFDDPELTALIDRATRGNLDLKIAVQRIAEARSSETSAAAQGLPSINGTASHTYQQSGLDALLGQIGGVVPVKPTRPPPAFGLYEGALDASWELDLFGKVRRSVEASRAATTAAIADRDDSLVSLQAEVAQNYARLRAAQADLAAAEADIVTERDLLALTKDRTAHGLTSALDVKNALAQLASSEAAAPQYAQQAATSMNALAVLAGDAPGALDAELTPVRPIPGLAAGSAPIGLPASLARRRPDIRAAEARLHAQTANVGVAVAQLYPDITLTGDIGQQSGQIRNFTKSYDNIFSIGPSISLPIFQGGKPRADIARAKAEQAEAALDYEKTVLSALQDVENALASYRTDRQRLRSLQTEGDADQEAVDIAVDRYRHGMSTYLDVLTPRNTLIQVEQQLIQARLSVNNDLVTLYKALGGGWQVQAYASAGPGFRTVSPMGR
jgi:NodT family efflux transporter outer membrane factor (OMF) lipoprotein